MDLHFPLKLIDFGLLGEGFILFASEIDIRLFLLFKLVDALLNRRKGINFTDCRLKTAHVLVALLLVELARREQIAQRPVLPGELIAVHPGTILLFAGFDEFGPETLDFIHRLDKGRVSFINALGQLLVANVDFLELRAEQASRSLAVLHGCDHPLT